jgi:ribosome-binding protein aMBF1 (putative translation factor)
MATKTSKRRGSQRTKVTQFVVGDDGATAAGAKEHDESPVGRSAVEGARARASRSQEYREARDEYAAIRKLREKNWIAAHIRERRYELDMTQEQVAKAAKTSHSYIARIEKGDHYPTMVVLQRILAVLDEELLIGIAERGGREAAEREIAPLPVLAGT